MILSVKSFTVVKEMKIFDKFLFKMNFATCIIDSTFPNIPNIVLGERKYK